MKPKRVYTADARRIAASFGLRKSDKDLTLEVTRANNLIHQLTSEEIAQYRASQSLREQYAASLACGWLDPIELLCIWYQEESRCIAAESAAAMDFYRDAYGE